MKCAADKVRQTNKSAEQCRIYGENFLDWTEVAFSYELANTYAYFRKAVNLQQFYDDTRDEMVGRVNQYMPDNYRVRDKRHGDRLAYDWEAQTDAILSARFTVDRQLADMGFGDTNWICMTPYPDTGWQSPEEVSKAEWRVQYWHRYGRNALLLWTGSNLLTVLTQVFSTGKERFSMKAVTQQVYLPFSEKVSRYAGRFLSGRAAGDRRNRQEVDAMQRWFREVCHIDIGSLGDERKPEMCREGSGANADPRFAEILQQVQNRGFKGY